MGPQNERNLDSTSHMEGAQSEISHMKFRVLTIRTASITLTNILSYRWSMSTDWEKSRFRNRGRRTESQIGAAGGRGCQEVMMTGNVCVALLMKGVQQLSWRNCHVILLDFSIRRDGAVILNQRNWDYVGVLQMRKLRLCLKKKKVAQWGLLDQMKGLLAVITQKFLPKIARVVTK